MAPSPDGFDEGARALGRIEAKVDSIGEAGHRRDAAFELMSDRLHRTANAIQPLVSQVEILQRGFDGSQVTLINIEARMQALEVPMKAAGTRRQQMRLFWRKVVLLSVTAASAIWFVAEPLLKIISEHWLRIHLDGR